jgi:hypothetical protein
VITRIIAKNIKVILQVGNNPRNGKNMGVPAHVMKRMFKEIFLNLVAI